MRILFLLLVALFISPTFAQDMGNICLLDDQDHNHALYDSWELKKIPDECKVGDILSIYLRDHILQGTRIASQFCDFEIQIIMPNLSSFGSLVCVIKTKTPRNEKGNQTQ